MESCLNSGRGFLLTLMATYLLGVRTLQYLQLNVYLTAQSPYELVVRWTYGKDPNPMKYYSLTWRDMLTDVKQHRTISANKSSYRLTNLTTTSMYEIQMSWNDGTKEISLQNSLKARPSDVYAKMVEKRKTNSAMTIFYLIIFSCTSLYTIVVTALIIYACKRRRRNRSVFSITDDTSGIPETEPVSTLACSSTLERYSKTEDTSLNRVSTFTGHSYYTGRVAPEDPNAGYERPNSFGYLHPTSTSPAIPPRRVPLPTYQAISDSHIDEHVYHQPFTPVHDRKGVAAVNCGKSSLRIPSSAMAHRPGKATVQRNQSMKSVTIRTDLDDVECASLPDISRQLLDSHGDAIQITLTLTKKQSLQTD